MKVIIYKGLVKLVVQLTIGLTYNLFSVKSMANRTYVFIRCKIMLDRRNLYDDELDVAEPLNEP